MQDDFEINSNSTRSLWTSLPCKMRINIVVCLPGSLWHWPEKSSSGWPTPKRGGGTNEIPLKSPNAKMNGEFVTPWTKMTSEKFKLPSWMRNPTDVCSTPEKMASRMPTTCLEMPSMFANFYTIGKAQLSPFVLEWSVQGKRAKNKTFQRCPYSAVHSQHLVGNVQILAVSHLARQRK